MRSARDNPDFPAPTQYKDYVYDAAPTPIASSRYGIEAFGYIDGLSADWDIQFKPFKYPTRVPSRLLKDGDSCTIYLIIANFKRDYGLYYGTSGNWGTATDVPQLNAGGTWQVISKSVAYDPDSVIRLHADSVGDSPPVQYDYLHLVLFQKD